MLGLPEEAVETIMDPAVNPRVFAGESHIHLVVTAVERTDSGYRPIVLDCLAGRNRVLTVHREPIDFLELFTDRILGDSRLGKLDAPAFIAAHRR